MKSKPATDAKGAFAPSQAKRESDGVESAKPTVVTGSQDGGKKIKGWNINHDISEVKQDNDQG